MANRQYAEHDTSLFPGMSKNSQKARKHAKRITNRKVRHMPITVETDDTFDLTAKFIKNRDTRYGVHNIVHNIERAMFA